MKRNPGAVTAAAAVIVIVSIAASCSPSSDQKAGNKQAMPAASVDGSLRLTESLHDMINDGTFATYQDVSLYSTNSQETASFSVAGTKPDGTVCQASFVLHPAKTGGRLKKADLNNNFGYVVGRIDNTTPNCTADGIYGKLREGGSGAIVARAVQNPGQGQPPYEARLARFPATPDTAVMLFTFCNHNKTGSNDKAYRAQYQPGSDPCSVTASFSRTASVNTSDGEVVSAATPIQNLLEIAWLGCFNDCCPASQPPDTAAARKGPHSKTPRP